MDGQNRSEQRYNLGAVPVSPDILAKAGVGLWAFELDEGKEPRMYVDETMLGLIGLTEQIAPEETYHAWYDHVDAGATGLVAAAVEKMTAGEHAEVQYAWRHPDGRTLMVRCGGVRNYSYTEGVRIEGTHRDVTEMLHLDMEKQRNETQELMLRLTTSLSDTYASLYYIVPETGEYRLFSRDADYEKNVISKLIRGEDFYTDVTRNVPQLILPEDIEKLSFLGSRETVEAAFGTEDSFSADYRIPMNGTPVWHRLKAVKYYEAGSLRYALGIANIDRQKSQEEQLKKNREIIEILASEYSSVYYIDLNTDGLTPYTMNESTESAFGNIFRSGISYSEAFRLYVSEQVLPADRNKMLRAGSIENILSELGNKKTFITSYRAADGHFSEMKFVKVGSEQSLPAAVALGFSDKDEELRAKMEEETVRKRNTDIIEILASEYSSVYYIDLTTDGLTPYTMNESTESVFGNIFRSGISYSEAFRLYVSEQVLPEDRNRMLRAGSIRNILSELGGKKTFLTSYRAADGHFSEMKFVKVGDEQGAPRAVALGFADKDEELRAKLEEETIRKRNTEIIEILASEYSSVYYIDLTTDGLTPYTMNEETESELGNIFRSGIRYSEAFCLYVETLVYKDDRPAMLRAGSIFNILKELADKKTFVTTYRSETSGTPHYCEMKFVKVGDEENPRAVALGFADKDEELRAEMERKELAARDAAVISGLSDDFGSVLYVDIVTGEEVRYRTDPLLSAQIPGWDAITDFPERLRTLADTLVHPDDRASFLEQLLERKSELLRTVEQEGVFYRNIRLLIDGKTVYHQIKFARDEHSRDHVLVGMRNVDDTVRHELEYQENLKAANRSKSDFLFNMSHDIRTPMNAIIGFTQMAKKYIDNKERVADSLTKIETSGQHLLELINEVLDMSRVESGKLHSEIKTVRVDEAAERLAVICRESAEQKGIDFMLVKKSILHPAVLADELHVNQILLNILGNAVKYTDEGGSVRYFVEETGSDREGYCRFLFTVEDTGVGMSKEYQKHIFESFSREESPSVSRVQGTGLGMAIVKKLIDYMDGGIEIDSEPGRGTKVTVSLYFKPEDTAAARQKELAKKEVLLKGRRVLLVEDNELNREIAIDILEEQGILIEEAVNGIEAVAKVEKNGGRYYDFVLMDIQMPLMNGYEATQKIRKLADTEALPIIALSANAFDSDKKKALEAGMNAHVSKPIVVRELIEALSSFVKQEEN